MVEASQDQQEENAFEERQRSASTNDQDKQRSASASAMTSQTNIAAHYRRKSSMDIQFQAIGRAMTKNMDNQHPKHDKSQDDAVSAKKSNLAEQAHRKKSLHYNTDFDDPDRNIAQMQKTMQFDHRLKEKTQILSEFESPGAMWRYNFQKKYLEQMKYVAIFIYYIAVPVFQPPNWCLKWYFPDRKHEANFSLDCVNAEYGTVKYFYDIPKLNIQFLCILDFICLTYLAFIQYFKATWRRQNDSLKRKIVIVSLIYLFSTGDLIQASIRSRVPYVSNFLRPIIVLVYLNSTRSNMKEILNDLKDSATVLITIFVFVFFYSVFGFYLYQSTYQGYSVFPTIQDSFYQMFILLTTTNFPDVMLVAYQQNRANCLFFISFLLLGFTFLFNVLLAVVFTSYKNRMAQKEERHTVKRQSYVENYFDYYDEEKKGYLTRDEAKKFFALVLDLNYHKVEDREQFSKLVHVVDLKGIGKLYRHDVIEFFQLPNFLDIETIQNNVANKEESENSEEDSDSIVTEEISEDNDKRSKSKSSEKSSSSSSSSPKSDDSNEKPEKSNQKQRTQSSDSLKSSRDDLDDEDYYRKSQNKDQQQDTTARKRTGSKFQHIPQHKESWVDMANDSEIFKQEMVSEQESIMRHHADMRERISNTKVCKSLFKVLQSTLYQTVIAAMVTLSLIQFVLVEYIISEKYYTKVLVVWIYITVVINMVFLVDLVLNYMAAGYKWVHQHRKVLYLEIVLQAMAFYALVKFNDNDYKTTLNSVSISCTIFLLRLLRLVELLSELKQFDLIYVTLMRFQSPFSIMMFSLYTVYFVFAQLGMALFSGRVHTYSLIDNPTIEPLFYLVNFNDFVGSYITLFTLMVVNNWWVTCNVYIVICNGKHWPVIYFIAFWVVTVCIMLNIVVAFVLEIYNSVEADTTAKYTRLNYILNLQRNFNEDSQTRQIAPRASGYVTEADIHQALNKEDQLRLRTASVNSNGTGLMMRKMSKNSVGDVSIDMSQGKNTGLKERGKSLSQAELVDNVLLPNSDEVTKSMAKQMMTKTDITKINDAITEIEQNQFDKQGKKSANELKKQLKFQGFQAIIEQFDDSDSGSDQEMEIGENKNEQSKQDDQQFANLISVREAENRVSFRERVSEAITMAIVASRVQDSLVNTRNSIVQNRDSIMASGRQNKLNRESVALIEEFNQLIGVPDTEENYIEVPDQTLSTQQMQISNKIIDDESNLQDQNQQPALPLRQSFGPSTNNGGNL